MLVDLVGRDLDVWITEKARQIGLFCEASEGKWDEDRAAILRSRCETLLAAIETRTAQ